jgi:RNA polymerase sigma-70 factor (ECF subfamily)
VSAERIHDGRFDDRIQALCGQADYRSAATLILQTLGPDVLRVICARFRDEDQAAEVFSRFAEDLWRGLPSFLFRCPLRVWVLTLSRNAGSRYLAREVHRERAQVPLSQAPELMQQADQLRVTTLAHLRSENRDRIASLRAKLSEEDQLLLNLRVDQKLEFREIAMVLRENSELPADELARETARLRKRFQLLKERLKRWIAEA